MRIVRPMRMEKHADYRKLIKHLDIKPEEFLMIGNSIKSGILPVLAIGGHGFHVPYHTTWAHERVERGVEHSNFRNITVITEVLPFLIERRAKVFQ